MKNEMLSGNPLKQILFFSVPFLIGNLFQQFYNVADMIIVGRTLDPEAYVAVGSVGSLVWFASGAVTALTVGFSAITARYFGAGDAEGVKKSFAVSLKLLALISIPMSVAMPLLARPILNLMSYPPDIFERSLRYIVWIFIGLFVTALFNILSNMIRALGDSKTPLYFLIVACGVNIVLDVVFISLCGMDTDGAGLATVIAQLISALCCVVYIKKKQPALHIGRSHFRRDGTLSFMLLRTGVPMAFLNMVLSVGGIAIQFVTNNLGSLYVSSTTTGSKIESFVSQPVLSFGSAVSVFAAQNLGAKNYMRVIEGTRKTFLLSYIWCAVASAIMLPFGRHIVTLIAGNVSPQVVENAYLYIVINTVLTVFLIPIVVYKSVLQAVGHTVFPLISGFTEIIGRAGVSFAVIGMMSAAVISNHVGFVIMCFAGPLAWLFGFLTVLPDYIMLKREYRRLSSCENAQ